MKKYTCFFFLALLLTVAGSSSVLAQLGRNDSVKVRQPNVLLSGDSLVISPADSLELASAGEDTTKLRLIAITKRGNRVAAKAQHKIAKLAFTKKKEQAAEREFTSLRKEYTGMPEATDAAYYLGVISMHGENNRSAKEYFTEYLQQGEVDSTLEVEPTLRAKLEWAWYYRAKALYRDKDEEYESSVRSYLSGNRIKTKSKEPTVRNELVRYLANRHKYDQAVEEGQEMIQRNPKDPLAEEMQFKIGDFLVLSGKHEEAEVHVRSLMKKKPANSAAAARAQFQLAAIYDSKNDIKAARREYASVKIKHPKVKRWRNASEFALAMLTCREWRQNRDSTSYADASIQTRKFLNDFPNDRHVPRALITYAELCAADSNYMEAVKAYDRIIAFDERLVLLKPEAAERSNDAKAHKELVLRARFSKAIVLRTNMQKPEDAVTEYDEILDEYPDNGEALLHKALSLIELERTEEAEEILKRLAESGGVERKTAQQILSGLVLN